VEARPVVQGFLTSSLVRRLRREGEKVRLRSQNGGYVDIVVPTEDANVQGLVVYVVHPVG
jgi:SOS-response transcriptional repressor LexA